MKGKRSPEGEERRIAAVRHALGSKTLEEYIEPHEGWLTWASSPHVMLLRWLQAGNGVDLPLA